MASLEQRIKRTPADREVVRLGREVAKASTWLSRVLTYEERPADVDRLQEELRAILLWFEESAAAGRIV